MQSCRGHLGIILLRDKELGVGPPSLVSHWWGTTMQAPTPCMASLSEPRKLSAERNRCLKKEARSEMTSGAAEGTVGSLTGLL